MGGGGAGRCRRVCGAARNGAAMLRRQARERREYLQRRAKEQQQQRQRERRENLRRALDENRLLPTELRHEALALQKELEFDFEAPGETGNSQDDEYKWAGLEPPKVMVTTSRDPSSRLRLFAKELCLLLPGARRMNRGRAELGALVGACRAAGVTDLLVLHETRGRPDGLTVSHLPHGPTAHFTLSGAVLRQEVGGLGGAPLAAPHLLLLHLDSTLGKRVGTILKHLFPVPRPDSRRVVTFANEDDVILEPRVPTPGPHGGAGGGGTPLPAAAGTPPTWSGAGTRTRPRPPSAACSAPPEPPRTPPEHLENPPPES
ncbi:U3 small nucleolar ribonucleoprotein IMP4 isoform 4-T4 [Sylvia borin]